MYREARQGRMLMPSADNAPADGLFREMSVDVCRSRASVYGCTRQPGHTGIHAAHGSSIAPLAVWDDEGAEARRSEV